MKVQSADKVHGTSAATKVQFDGWAGNYDAALERGLSLSGEGKDFFARGRVAWLQRRLKYYARSLHGGSLRLERVLDFGCGTGTSTPLLLELEGVKTATGVDVSRESIATAERRHGTQEVQFKVLRESDQSSVISGQSSVVSDQYDLAFCNGVFHHIAPVERKAAAEYVYRSLRPGGVFAFCENNPWNPGTRLVMRRIEFDRDAMMLSAGEARRLLRGPTDGHWGFEVLFTDFLFFFPRFLAHLRRFESWLCRIPLGAQYMCLARKTA